MSAANEVAMTEAKLRETIGSLDVRLDDVRREQGWRAIERALDTAPVTAPRRARGFAWPLAFGLAAATAAVLAVLLVRQPATGPSLSTLPATELVAVEGQTTMFERAGIALSLFGPGTATVEGTNDAVRVDVKRGTLLAERAPDAPALSIAAGGSTTLTKDRRFAVHVSPTMVVMGSDERANQIIEHHSPVPVPDSGSGAASPTALLSPTPNPTPTPTLSPNPNPNPNPTPTPTLTPTPTPIRKPRPNPAPHPNPSLTPNPMPNPNPTPSPTLRPSPPSPTANEVSPPSPLPDLQLDAVELYRRAETSLSIRDPLTARAQLEQLLREFPSHPLVDAARYDLALLARTYGEHERALQLLAHIRTHGKDKNVRAAAARLEQQLTSAGTR